MRKGWRGGLLALCAALLWLPAAVAWGQDASTPSGPSVLDEIKARGELRVGLEAGYMPFEMRDKRGGIIGFDVDLAKLMARKLGVRLTLVNTQWDGIIPALLTGKFDVLMSGMTITEDRAKQVDFADPYIIIGQSVIMQPKLAATVHGVDDLNKPEYIVATKLGTTGDTAAAQYMPRAQIMKFETEAEALLQVRSGTRPRLRLRPAVQRGLHGAQPRHARASVQAVHARGTRLGDPQERSALARLAQRFPRRRASRQGLRCALRQVVRAHGLAEVGELR